LTSLAAATGLAATLLQSTAQTAGATAVVPGEATLSAPSLLSVLSIAIAVISVAVVLISILLALQSAKHAETARNAMATTAKLAGEARRRGEQLSQEIEEYKALLEEALASIQPAGELVGDRLREFDRVVEASACPCKETIIKLSNALAAAWQEGGSFAVHAQGLFVGSREEVLSQAIYFAARPGPHALVLLRRRLDLEKRRAVPDPAIVEAVSSAVLSLERECRVHGANCGTASEG
jgi:hypothetical protein